MDVQLPDGSIARFPDDMPETEIRTQLLKVAPKAKPASDQPVNDRAHVALGGLIEGIPIAGPVIRGGLDRTGAYLRSLASGNSYDDELAFVQGKSQGLKDEHPVIDTGAQITGAVAGTLPMIAAAPVAMGVRGATLGGRALAGAGSGSAIGAADAAVRSGGDPTSIGVGGGLGFVAGGAAPYVGRAVGEAARTVAAPVVARFSPDGAARTALVRTLQRSGRTPQEITAALEAAQADGQGMFTVADAMGHAGQRQLSSIARLPGNGERQALVEALESRQAGQGVRIGSFVDDALGSSQTARQSSTALKQEAQQTAAPLYRQAEEAGPMHSDRLAAMLDDPVAQSGLAKGVEAQRLEALARGEPFNPQDLAITGFDASGAPVMGGVPNIRTIQAVKTGLDDILESYRDPTSGRLNLDSRGRAIEMYRQSLLREVDALNPAYAEARAAYAGPASITEDISRGQTAATRGRAADNIDVFSTRPAANQQGYRQGYADTVNARIERNAGPGTNQARPFTSQKSQQEMRAFSQTPDQADRFGRQIGREQTMFETRRQAIGGSQTADNLADQADLGMLDPTIVGKMVTGDVFGALRQGGQQLLSNLQGMPQPVRQRIATVLLQSDPSRAGQDLASAIARGDDLTTAQIATARALLGGSGIAAN